jgi:hypothetical protein
MIKIDQNINPRNFKYSPIIKLKVSIKTNVETVIIK